MEIIYTLSGCTALVLCIVLVIGMIRPTLLTRLYSPLHPKRLNRGFIFATTLPAIIVSGMILGATEPASIKQRRIEQDAAAIRLVDQQTEADRINTENARKAEELKQKEISIAAENAKKEAARQKELSQSPAPVNTSQAVVETPPQHTTPSTPSPSPSPPQQPTPTSPRVVRQGSFCSAGSANAVFSSGSPAVCARASDGRFRWQSP